MAKIEDITYAIDKLIIFGIIAKDECIHELVAIDSGVKLKYLEYEKILNQDDEFNKSMFIFQFQNGSVLYDLAPANLRGFGNNEWLGPIQDTDSPKTLLTLPDFSYKWQRCAKDYGEYVIKTLRDAL